MPVSSLQTAQLAVSRADILGFWENDKVRTSALLSRCFIDGPKADRHSARHSGNIVIGTIKSKLALLYISIPGLLRIFHDSKTFRIK